MTIKLLIDSVYYDISSLVTPEVFYSDDISKELDIANFFIPVCKSDSIVGLDLSVPLPQLTKVEVTIDSEIKRYYTREYEVERIGFVSPYLYSHKVDLIEPTKLLELKPITDMAITQPAGTYTIASSQLNINPSDRSGAFNDLLLTTDAYTLVDLENTTTPTDTSYIDEEILKIAGREYTLYFDFSLYSLATSIAPDFDIRIKINGVTQMEEVITGKLGVLERSKATYTLTYTPSVINELVTVEIRPTGTLPTDSSVYAETVGVTITTKIESVNSPVWYYDEVIDKALESEKVQDLNDTTFTAEFTLADNTRNAIKNYIAPELTFERYTVWELLEELADIIKAIPRLSANTWNEITFDFIDSLNKDTFTNTHKTEERQKLVLDKFSTAIEVNADNVIESIEDQAVKVEPYENGWMTLRSTTEGPNKLTDTTVGLKVRNNIYKHKQILARGFTVEYSDATTSPSTSEWDISDYVVEEKKWGALKNLAYDNSTDRLIVNQGKGNTIYYSKSSQRYVNFGYQAPKPTAVSVTPDPAIYQIIAAVATQVTGKTVTKVNTVTLDAGGGGFTPIFPTLMDSQYRVYYTSFKKVRVKLYKHNARDYEFDSILYSNERAKVNDNVRLGRYNQSLVNKSGNKTNNESGITTDFASVPKVGQIINGDQIITKVDVTVKNGLYEYGIAGYVKYAELSNFVGINSEYRQYEIPDKDVVERILVYEDFISVGRADKTATHNVLEFAGLTLLSNPLTLSTVTDRVTYHRMSTRNTALNPGDAGWTTFDSESEGPIDILSLGTTTAIVMNVKDNYSIDNNVEETETDTWYQNNVQYTNVFGQYDSARYEVYVQGATNNSVADGNTYPGINNAVTVNKVLSVDIRVKKDAREAINFIYQANFFAQLESGVENFRVYDGIAKYNGFAIEDAKADIVPVLLLDGYFPSVESVTIDPTKYVETTASVVQGVATDKIKIYYDINVLATPTSILYTGWGLIEKTSGELIFMAQEDIQSNSSTTVIYQDIVELTPDKTKGK